jgi:hypothetical protein
MSVEILVRPARLEDAAALVDNIREADAMEAESSAGETVLAAAERSLLASEECWSVLFNGQLACVWGVTLDPSHNDKRVGYGWLVTTKVVDRYPKTFWQLCLKTLPQVLDRWFMLGNWIDARHTQALRWARRLGFSLLQPVPYGPQALDFVPFVLTKQDFLRRGALWV